jgi:hypothetical protein
MGSRQDREFRVFPRILEVVLGQEGVELVGSE